MLSVFLAPRYNYTLKETPPVALCPAPESSEKEEHGPFGAGTEEGHKNDERDEVSLL